MSTLIASLMGCNEGSMSAPFISLASCRGFPDRGSSLPAGCSLGEASSAGISLSEADARPNRPLSVLIFGGRGPLGRLPRPSWPSWPSWCAFWSLPPLPEPLLSSDGQSSTKNPPFAGFLSAGDGIDSLVALFVSSAKDDSEFRPASGDLGDAGDGDDGPWTNLDFILLPSSEMALDCWPLQNASSVESS